MKHGLRHLVLACALTLVTGPAIAAKTPAPSKDALAQDKAQIAFQRDLVSVLATQVDAMPLLGAALLARPLADQPKNNSFAALIKRATYADGTGPAITWMRLADCDAKAGNCPNAASLEQLLAQAPDNAATWLIKLGTDVHDGKQDDARQDLARAAAAKSYDDYTGVSLKALAGAVGTLPPPAGSFDAARKGGAIGMQTVLAFGMASSQPQPTLQLVAQLCEGAAEDASIKSDCLKLGKVLEWGSSPLARSLGLHLREKLSDQPDQQQDAVRARRTLVWQVQNFGQLLARVQDDPAIAQRLLALARNGGTEMSLMLAALRDNNIPVDAPADWEPGKAKSEK